MGTTDPRIRANDSVDSVAWKQRQIPISQTDPDALINGRFGRVLAYAKAVKLIGVDTVVGTLLIGWLFGFWQIPVVDKYLMGMLANDQAILTRVDALTQVILSANLDRARIVHALFTAIRAQCEQQAQERKQSIAPCATIHE